MFCDSTAASPMTSPPYVAYSATLLTPRPTSSLSSFVTPVSPAADFDRLLRLSIDLTGRLSDGDENACFQRSKPLVCVLHNPRRCFQNK